MFSVSWCNEIKGLGESKADFNFSQKLQREEQQQQHFYFFNYYFSYCVLKRANKTITYGIRLSIRFISVKRALVSDLHTITIEGTIVKFNATLVLITTKHYQRN